MTCESRIYANKNKLLLVKVVQNFNNFLFEHLSIDFNYFH